MICPNCKRVISDNEICTCKLEAVKRKNEELKREKAEAEARAAQEEKQRQDELNKKKQEAKEKSDILKNNMADLSTNIMSDFLDFIDSPDYAAVSFAKNKNKLAIIIASIMKLIFTIFAVFSLSRSSLATLLRTNGHGVEASIIAGVSIFIASLSVDLLINILKNKNIDDVDIIYNLGASSAKFVIQSPVLLVSAVVAAISGPIGLGIMSAAIAVGAAIDFLSNISRNSKAIFLLTLSYMVKLPIILIILFNF